MNTEKFETKKGEFVVFDLPIQFKEFNYGGVTKILHEGKKIVPLDFVNTLSKDHCLEIVEEYGPFGEYKGGRHPNGGGMTHRAYGDPLTALKCILKDNNIDFENGYIFKIQSN